MNMRVSLCLVGDLVPLQNYLLAQISQLLDLTPLLPRHQSLDLVCSRHCFRIHCQTQQHLQDPFAEGYAGFEGFFSDLDAVEPAFEFCQSVSFQELFADVVLSGDKPTFLSSLVSSER